MKVGGKRDKRGDAQQPRLVQWLGSKLPPEDQCRPMEPSCRVGAGVMKGERGRTWGGGAAGKVWSSFQEEDSLGLGSWDVISQERGF